jgi:myo-inositol-1(or 4)-monophosphatase
VIDPLDGTNNFAHGVPHFSVSIALLMDGQPHLGVVLNPLSGECFVAEHGRGAYLGEQQLQVSAVGTLARSLLSTGFSYDYATQTHNNLAEFDRVQRGTQGVRRMGSAALDLCFVGAGRFEAHWEYRLSAWDSAAGALVVAEAGGELTDLAGAAWHPFSPSLVASNRHIHRELLATLQGHDGVL